MTAKHVLAQMTFREFEQRLPEKPVIILPLGSQEEQGPTAPMGDFMLTEALAARVAERCGAIAAPTIPFGYADHFRAVPGGVQLRAGTFCRLLRDVADNFLDHGLRHLVILNGHTGNAPLIDRVARDLRAERQVLMPSLNLWRLQTAELWEKAYGVPAKQGFAHGGEPVSSVYAHLFPELMRPDLAERPENGRRFLGFETAGTGAIRFGGVEVAMPLNIDEVTGNGMTGGDPAMCSAEAGAQVTEHIVSLCAEFITRFRAATASSEG
ncbi:creatininase family protein [Roseomonas elaeocarpi]|uniref:Creatininase family protein n=1 Tax=Roseomonas elaeocarpi TaxID=907779 RepID=A0ABV6JSA8_9PROT